MSSKQEEIHYSITGEQKIHGGQAGVLEVIKLCLESGFFSGINQVLDHLTQSLSAPDKNSPQEVAERMIDWLRRSAYYRRDE